jgi:isopentenyldiphosphate isomerase
MKNYLQKTIYIAHVDRGDKIIEPVERWKAHEEGILHRAFTVAAFYHGAIICQHRKHPVFDGVLDLTASSHPQMVDMNIQSNEEAIYNTLLREWGMKPEDISNLENRGHVIYKTKDPLSIYTEHELCYLYTCDVSELPHVNFEVAYGFSLQRVSDLKNEQARIHPILASWVEEFIKAGLL